MKNLKTYENYKGTSTYSVGDMVVCIEDWQDILKLGEVYVIKKIENDNRNGFFIILEDDEYDREWRDSRFRKATKKEIDEYLIKKDMKKYNI